MHSFLSNAKINFSKFSDFFFHRRVQMKWHKNTAEKNAQVRTPCGGIVCNSAQGYEELQGKGILKFELEGDQI